MDLGSLVYGLQASISALGVFICFWGFTNFAPCLWRVLRGDHLSPAHQQCPYHAATGLTCIAGMAFCFARMNAVGFFQFGTVAVGLAYIVGMVLICIVVALSVWAQNRRHEQAALSAWRTPVPNTLPLSRIIWMVIIISLAFIAVGLVRAGS